MENWIKLGILRLSKGGAANGYREDFLINRFSIGVYSRGAQAMHTPLGARYGRDN